MFEVTIEETFAAGHALRNYRGKCENVHGHNYRCQVTLAGAELDSIGLLVDFVVTTATGTAECAVVPPFIAGLKERGFHPQTLGADKGYDTHDLVQQVRATGVTPHVTQNTGGGRRSAIDGRTTVHSGYAVSQRIRKRVEEIFGWMKTTGGMRKTRYRGLGKVDFTGYLVGAAYNLVRMARLAPATTA